MTLRALNHPTASSPSIVKEPFGVTKGGLSVDQYTLTSGNGVSTSILTWGGIIRTLYTPGRDGVLEDIVLGYDTLAPYEERHPYFGTIAGRFANRIAKGRFSLDGHTYTLALNNGPNHLHGGTNGFDRAVWQARTETRPDSVLLLLSHVSPDGDEGYPGELTVQVTYTLYTNNTLRIDYSATTTKATPVNLTSHSYFNLAGHGSGNVLKQKLQVYADKIVAVDETQIPTGSLQAVIGTPFDFTKPRSIGDKTIGDKIGAVGSGYDHTFVLQQNGPGLKRAAVAWDPVSGRALEVVTTEPGVQLYTGNSLTEKEVGKGNIPYRKHAGFCLETQHFPDSVNQPNFPNTILRPGETYQQSTTFKFGVIDYGD